MATWATPTTTALLAAATAGDQAAWNDLIDRFSSLVWAVARAHGLDAHDAADVHQTVWLRLTENLGRLREPEALPGWLRITTRHECLRHSRRGAREAPVDWQQFTGIPDENRAEETVLTDERTTIVGAALARLTQKCQALLHVFAYSPDTGYTEIGQTLGMPVGSIGPTRARCLTDLRKHLEAVGYLPAREGAR